MRQSDIEMREALERIANPILHMQREVPDGHQFDGQMARSLVTVEYLQGIARDVLALPGKSLQTIAAQVVEELDGLIEESHGVSGLHLNGDDAPWEDVLAGGRFERLTSLDDLRTALAVSEKGAR